MDRFERRVRPQNAREDRSIRVRHRLVLAHLGLPLEERCVVEQREGVDLAVREHAVLVPRGECLSHAHLAVCPEVLLPPFDHAEAPQFFVLPDEPKQL
eukprot:1963630-Prymnesium_polylepis.1